MTENKPIMIDGIDVSKCADYDEDAYFTCQACNVCKCSELPNCYFKQLARKTQECEELREYHNKCCEEFENEKKELLEKYNQLSRDFYSGKYCNVEKCKQLDQLKVSKKQTKQKLEKIREFATALCYAIMSDGVVTLQKDILQIIDEVE